MDASGKAKGSVGEPGQRQPRRRRGSWLVAFLAVPLVVLAGAWLSVPAWGPKIAGAYLPEDWTLEDVKLSVPGPGSAGVPLARLSIPLPGARLDIRSEGAVVSYRDLGVRIDKLDVTMERITPDDAAPRVPWSADDLALPRLVLPAGIPRASVGTLDLTYRDGARVQAWQFRDLVLDSADSGLKLNLDVDQPPYLDVPLTVALDATTERLDIEVMQAGGAAPLLSYEQWLPGKPGARGAEAPSDIARADLHLDLAFDAIKLEELEPWLAEVGLPVPVALDGRLRATASFAGETQLDLDVAAVQGEDIDLVLPDGRLVLSFDSAMIRAPDVLKLDIKSASIRATGELERVRQPLGDTLQASGIDLPLSGPLSLELALGATEPAGTGLDATEAAGNTLDHSVLPAAGLTARIGLAHPHRVTVEAGLDMAAWLGDAVTLNTRLDSLTVTSDDPARMASYDLRTNLDAQLRITRPFALRANPLTLGANEADLQLAGDVARPADGALAFEGTLGNNTLTAFSLAHPASTVRLDRLAVDGDLAMTAETIRWVGQANGTQLITAPGDAVAANSLMTADAVRFRGEAAGPPAQLTVRGEGRLDGVLLPDLAVTLDGVDLDLPRLELPAVDAEFTALTQGLEAALGETVYRGFDLDLSGTLDNGESLAGAGELLLGFSGALPFGIDARLDTAEATVTLDQATLPASAFADAARAAAVTLPESLLFSGGAAVLDGMLSMGPAGLGGQIDVRGDALAFALGESRFEGLEFSTSITVADVMRGDGPLLLELAQLAAGLDLIAVSTALTFSGDEVGLIDLDAQLLGGTLSSPALRVTAGDLADSVIRWAGFDLGMLFTVLDVDGLEGEGTLDATLPLKSVGGQPAIEGATFAARGPGRLRYSTGGPATNIGLQALENFEYDSLEGTLDYEPDGGYTIGLDLLGKNPDLYGGHPIRFRLNLGGAMPALFRSLFVTGNFEEAIIERLRAGEPLLDEEAADIPPPGVEGGDEGEP